jgi:serine/threonine protein kinase
VSAPLQPGAVLDGYEIVSLLGRGGMGAVYRARRDGVGEVALKTLIGGVTQEELDRFRREAQLLASLRHPAIVPVHTAGQVQGLLYFAMGLVEGESLEAKIRREGPLPPEKAVRLLCQIADAVGYANERKIVHRDLKPANVLLDESGNPYVTDFGLARQMDENERDRLTRTGEIMGTPSFMSPEQAMGRTREIDERTDVYGLGGILYAALAGRPPFQGRSPFETIKLVRESEPEAIGGAVSPALEDFVARALAKRPDDRPATAREFARELEEALRDRGGISRLVLALLGVTFVCVVATGLLVWRVVEKRHESANASPTPAPTPTPAKSNQRLTQLLENITASLDRKVWPSPDYIRQLHQEVPHATADPDRAALEPVLVRLYDQAASGADVVRLEQLTTAEIPLPEDPDLRKKVAQRWLAGAFEHSRTVRMDPAFAAMSGLKTQEEIEAYLRRGIVNMKPVFDRLVHARAADPTLPPFPPVLEDFFLRVLVGSHIVGSDVFEASWREAFGKYKDQPLSDLLEAKFELSRLNGKLDLTVKKHNSIRTDALTKLGLREATERAALASKDIPRTIELAYNEARDRAPTNPAIVEAEAQLVEARTELSQAEADLRDKTLVWSEKFLSRLDDSNCSREYAELTIYDVARHLMWDNQADRVVAVFEKLAAVVAPTGRDYVPKFVAASIAFVRCKPTPAWNTAEGERIRTELGDLTATTADAHDRHLGEVTQVLTEKGR